MPCPSIIYSGRFDGGFFITASPWTKCYVYISVDPEDPFSGTYHVSANYQPNYELVWLHGCLPHPLDPSAKLYLYKPFRPYESATSSD